MNLWRTTRTWFARSKSWMEDPWEKIVPDEVDSTFENCMKLISQTYRFFKDRNFPKIFEITEKMKAQIDQFKPIVPLALALRKDGMKERHWKAISDSSGIECYPDEDFTLSKLVDMGMVAHVAICDEVGEKAQKEFFIEKSLAKMKKEWEGMNFLLPRFKNTSTYTISGFDDAVTILDEHIVTAQAMQFSPFKKPFEEEIE